MFNYLYYRLRHSSYLKNDHGIKKFAEWAMGQLIRKATKKSATYREMNENMLVEKANLRLRSSELQERTMLDASEFFSTRRRLRANNLLIGILVAAAVLLYFPPLVQFIGDAAEGTIPFPVTIIRITAAFLSVGIIFGGLLTAERLIETVLSDTPHATSHRQAASLGMAALWGMLLAGIELSIYGFSSVRAAELAATQGTTTALYLGYVTLALLLPLLAGAVRWDYMRFIDVYETTKTLRDIESRLAQIDSLLRQNDEYESNFYKLKSIAYWDAVNEFKTYKDNYNRANSITEAIGGHFSQSYDAFQGEANKRYDTDIRDVTAKSMRRLERTEAAAGSKLGQQRGASRSDRASSRPTLTPAGHNGNGHTDGPKTDGSEEAYLETQPVR